jgi:Lrp/AsnC family transcriptional regulator for asnA, asnC and gidA
VQRLIDDGVLDVVGVTDPIALGFPVMAMVAVSASGDVRVVADRLGAIENVIYLVLTSGEHDLLVEVVCRSPDELLAVVNDRIRAVRNPRGTARPPSSWGNVAAWRGRGRVPGRRRPRC